MKATTMSDIAKAVGVSTMTVSKVLNHRPNVSEKTAERVLAAARRLNYKPNMIAKSMRLNRTKTIGLVISDSSFSFFPSVIKGVEDCAAQNGYSILLCNTNGDLETEREKVELLVNKRVDGLILAASRLTGKADIEYLQSLNIAFVYTIRIPMEDAVDCVANDNFSGALMMVDYLIRTGSQRIHFFNMQSNSSSASQRLAGYRQAFYNHGMEVDETIIHKIDHTIESGYALAKKLLENGERIQTVFCGCDIIAIGAMEAALEMGYRIPEDIRVASYDDIDLAQYLRVPLTTVRQPKYEIGSQSVELLLEKIAEPERAYRHIILKPELIIRKST